MPNDTPLLQRPSSEQAKDLVQAVDFADLLGRAFALRYTGAITLHLHRGHIAEAYLGAPLRVQFLDPHTNEQANRPQKS